VDKVKTCANGKDGQTYLSEMGNKTSKLDPQLQSVPAVAINNVRKLQIFLRKWNLVKHSAVDYCNGGRCTDNLELVLQSCIIQCLCRSTQSAVTISSSKALPLLL